MVDHTEIGDLQQETARVWRVAVTHNSPALGGAEGDAGGISAACMANLAPARVHELRRWS
jgi:hypothetical protein